VSSVPLDPSRKRVEFALPPCKRNAALITALQSVVVNHVGRTHVRDSLVFADHRSEIPRFPIYRAIDRCGHVETPSRCSVIATFDLRASAGESIDRLRPFASEEVAIRLTNARLQVHPFRRGEKRMKAGISEISPRISFSRPISRVIYFIVLKKKKKKK